jgi:hypothetical protein
MFHGIGSLPDGLGKIAAHGVGGGIMAELQGGKFGHGFVSAGVTEALSPELMAYNPGAFEQTAIAALVGGTASALSGGKFANGAVTAAFQMAFNHAFESSRGRSAAAEESSGRMAHMAYRMLSRGPGPDGVVTLSWGELNYVMSADSAHIDAKYGGQFALSAYPPWYVAWQLRNEDGLFWGDVGSGFGGTSFRFSGAPPEFGGSHRGGDINYAFQGMLNASALNSKATMNISIKTWNSIPGAGDASHGAIGERIKWANFGYDYYMGRP